MVLSRFCESNKKRTTNLPASQDVDEPDTLAKSVWCFPRKKKEVSMVLEGQQSFEERQVACPALAT
jgi:hypothetical protein